MAFLKNAVSWFEIPVADMSRAKKFYENIFGFELQEMRIDNILHMALFPVEKGEPGGALCYHPQFYFPGNQGPLIYLNADPDLSVILSKVEENGGKILKTKTKISDEYGFMALFTDSEGNRMALHSGN